MDKNTKMALMDLVMSSNPYDQKMKELLKNSLIESKKEEGYAHLSILNYLNLQTMLEEMEL